MNLKSNHGLTSGPIRHPTNYLREIDGVLHQECVYAGQFGTACGIDLGMSWDKSISNSIYNPNCQECLAYVAARMLVIL